MKAKILVVDDEPDLLRVLEFCLRSEGYEVITALGGQEALASVAKELPDLVILDVMMPDMDGLALCRTLRRRPESAKLPIMMLSALSQVSDKVKGLEAGADEYITKPMSLEELVARVRALLERRRLLALPEPAGPPKVIGVIGAKGGVGTSTVALNLAAAMAQRSRSVIAMELPGRFGTFATQLNWTPMETDGRLLATDVASVDAFAVVERLFSASPGLRVLFGPQDADEIREPAESFVQALLAQTQNSADYVVVDLNCGSSDADRAVACQGDLIILVVEPELTSVICAKWRLELLGQWGIPKEAIALVVVNRSGLTSGVRLAEIRSQLGCEILGVMPPAGDACALAVERGVPLIELQPDHVAASTLIEIAGRITAAKAAGIAP